MIIIDPPKFEHTARVSEIKDIPAGIPGVYFLFDDMDTVLYIGISKDIKTRLHQHFYGLTNTSRYNRKFSKASYFCEHDQLYREIYELFLINKYQPQANIARKEIVINVEKTDSNRCNFIRDNGTQCKNKASTNGFCRHHGGNGITKTEYLRIATLEYQREFEK